MISQPSPPSPLLVDLGPAVFVSKETEPCARWSEYADVFLWDNAPLMAKGEGTDGNRQSAELDMISSMTRGQRISYALANFDAQVCNGGVAQFLYNRGDLVDEVLHALDQLELRSLKILLTDALGHSSTEGLHEARQVGADEVAKHGYGQITERSYEFYERERLRIEAQARRLEDGYFPTWEGRTRAEGPLRTEMCAALNAYVEAHPSEFQVVRAQ